MYSGSSSGGVGFSDPLQGCTQSPVIKTGSRSVCLRPRPRLLRVVDRVLVDERRHGAAVGQRRPRAACRPRSARPRCTPCRSGGRRSASGPPTARAACRPRARCARPACCSPGASSPAITSVTMRCVIPAACSARSASCPTNVGLVELDHAVEVHVERRVRPGSSRSRGRSGPTRCAATRRPRARTAGCRARRRRRAARCQSARRPSARAVHLVAELARVARARHPAAVHAADRDGCGKKRK